MRMIKDISNNQLEKYFMKKSMFTPRKPINVDIKNIYGKEGVQGNIQVHVKINPMNYC